MKISAKLIIAFVAVALMALLVGIIGITQLTNINSQHIDLYENYGNSQGLIGQINTEFLKWRMDVRDMVLDKDPAKTQTYADKIKAGDDVVSTTLSQYDKLCTLPAEQQNFKDLKAAIEAYKTFRDRITNLAVAGSYDEAYTVLRSTDSTNASSAADKIISSTVTNNIDVGAKTSAALSTTVSGVIWLLIIIVAVAVIGAVLLGLLLSQSISKSINAVVKAAKQLSAGDTNVNLNIKSKDETAELANAVSEVSASLKKMIADANMLSAAAIEGKLATRADATAHQGDYRRIVEGVNNTLDAVIGPLNVAANYVDRISKGDVPEKITDSYNGDFNVIKKNLNTCIDAVNKLVADANMLSAAAIEGKLATRADATAHQGDYRKIVDGVNKTLDAVIGPLNVAANYVDRISKGDLPEKITDSYNGDFNIIKNNLNTCIDAINKLVADANMLSIAAVEGKLATRADASKHQGDYRKIVDGVNQTLDSVINPINETVSVMKLVSTNDYTKTVNGNYAGVPKEMADTVNSTIERLLSVQNVFTHLADGDTSLLESYARIGKRSENDKILPAAIQVMRTIDALVGEATVLSTEAVNGNLDTRGNAEKFNGKYKQLIQGINNTLDAMARPLVEAIAVLDNMAADDYTLDMSEEYNGAFKNLAVSVNHVQETLNRTLNDINVAAEQVASGTQQVSAGSQALSQGATEQASAIEQLTASVTEIASQTKQNAMNANQASELALTARDNAVDGNTKMKEMQQAMTGINEASASISKIIKVIDEIAFQTNLLALNAAVEAARAGQHGKGFAVVAEEVRNLAQRSAGAAKETTSMIEESIKKVKAGTEMADETAHALDKIVIGVEKATNLVGGIAKASNDQATAVSQINRGIEQVSQVVQTNSATAEESAAASEELTSQAELLKDMVGRFSLKGQQLQSGKQKAALRQQKSAGNAGTDRQSSKPRISMSTAEFGKY